MSIKFDAPPTVARFMKSEAFGRIIAGPVGSGKTTGCVVELLRRAIEQNPGENGLRHTRFAIVRQTLKQLKDTVLKDCRTWLDGGLGDWKVSDNTFYVRFMDVTSEWVFIPLEDYTDQARLLSMQLTGAWMSECIEMDFSVLAPLSGRIGRYPSAAAGTPTWQGIIADTNMPTEMTPWQMFMENPPPNWQIFRQPSGMDPPIFNAAGEQISGAENLNHLNETDETHALPLNHPRRIAQGRRYYERFLEMNADQPDWLKRYVYAQYGNDPSGRAVFANTFNPSFHLVEDTMVIPGYPLIIGQDFGRNPWSVICQADHLGRLIVHEEVPAHNIGLEKHVVQSLRPRLLHERYSMNRFLVVGDPSGVAKGNVAEESCFDALGRMGLPWLPAPTNDIEPRLRAVESLLGRQVNGGPMLMINKTRAPFLARAMSGGYRFLIKKAGALGTVPDKNDKEGFSHVSDALQYAALMVHGGLQSTIAQRLSPRPRFTPRHVTSAGWT